MMNANSHFAQLPAVNIERSRMRIPFRNKTTFNAGDIIPIYWQEILPGSTISLDLSSLVRMTTPVFPVMDDCYLDIFAFNVPNRLVLKNWQALCGENESTYWEQPIEYEVPQIYAPVGGWQKGTIADYMGVPTNIEGFSLSALPFRCLAKIYNDWFRDQNLKQPCNLYDDDVSREGSNGTNYVLDVELGGMPPKAAKFHDQFTSCLPSAQKGTPAGFSINGGDHQITFQSLVVPVVGNGTALGLYSAGGSFGVINSTGDGFGKDGFRGTEAAFGAAVGGSVDPYTYDGYANQIVGVTQDPTKSGMVAQIPEQSATISIGNLGHVTINELREAFAVQRFLELQARTGSRYVEILRASFGVISPDARLQRSEFLGSHRIYVNMDSVIQTSESATTPQGNVSGYSVTGDRTHLFTHSFVEHGYLFIVGVVRNLNTYQQGLEEAWQRKNKFDFYWPNFAHIGEQPIRNKTIYLQPDSVVAEDGTPVNEQTFGFQEAWSSYRYKPSRVSGLFRSNVNGSLDSWHYADYYNSLPVLSGDWIDSSPANIARTLAVQDEDQFFGDFYVESVQVLPMPVYSIPGLLDHF